MKSSACPTLIVAPAKAGVHRRSDPDAVLAAKRDGLAPSQGRRLLIWVLASLAAALTLLAVPAAAQDLLPPAPYAYKQLDDPRQEEKALALMEQLRCLKCQSQSIADSDAPMAGDMRHQVRTRIAAGESPEHIRQWLIERYGDYVTYKPPLRPLTAPLFAAPAVFVIVAVLLLRRRFVRRRRDQS